MSWLPTLGLAVLGAFLLQKALRESARRTWAWGRAGEGPPLSRKAYAVWGLTFLYVAWLLRGAPGSDLIALGVLLTLFVAILGVGYADSSAHRASRGRRRPDG